MATGPKSKTGRTLVLPKKGRDVSGRGPCFIFLVAIIALVIRIIDQVDFSSLHMLRAFRTNLDIEHITNSNLPLQENDIEPEAEAVVEPQIPKVRVGGRVIDIINGWHWDNLLQNIPDKIRPPSAIWFYDPRDAQCVERFNQLRWDEVAETKLPSRERLMTASYNIHAAKVRSWYKFTPEMDLAARLQVQSCPELVFVPRECNGDTDWCSRGKDPSNPHVELLGCHKYNHKCNGFEKWDGQGDWVNWTVSRTIAAPSPPTPQDLGSYGELAKWMHEKDVSTTVTHLRNILVAPLVPYVTSHGFKVDRTPEDVHEWLLNYYRKHEAQRFLESSSSQSLSPEPVAFMSMHHEEQAATELVTKHVMPVIKAWTQLNDLELISLGGLREYPEGSVLKSHIGEKDEPIFTVALSIIKYNMSRDTSSASWPFDMVQPSGDIVRFQHLPGTMVMYESSKIIHGRQERSEDGIFVNWLLHFRRRNFNDTRWQDAMAKSAASFQENHIVVPFHSTSSTQPENSVVAPIFVGHVKPNVAAPRRKFLVTFINERPTPVEINWISPAGQRFPSGIIDNMKKLATLTFCGHHFLIRDVQANKDLFTYNMTQTHPLIIIR